MQEKGGEDEFGPYEVVANWPQPIPGMDGWTWGSTGGVFAETPDRVWIGQRGMLPLKEGAKPGDAGRLTATTRPALDPLGICRRPRRQDDPDVAAG